MAWTAPTTRTTGTLITAAIWNTDVVDNLTYLGNTHDHTTAAGAGGGAALAAAGIPSMVNGTAAVATWTSTTSISAQDVTGGSISLTLDKARAVVLIASGQVNTNNSSGVAYILGNVDGTAGQVISIPVGADSARHLFGYVQHKAAVAAGARVAKLQGAGDGSYTTTISYCNVVAFAI